MPGLYVQYGCGLSAPDGWLNFDSSPTLRVQRLPVVGRHLARVAGPVFPAAVRYGDIVKGLPLQQRSCAAVYASHVLEHLALNDCRRAGVNTHRLLQTGGVFRLIVPDLEMLAQRYLASSDPEAGERFLLETDLGLTDRPRGLAGLIRALIGGSRHLWMWDYKGMSVELENAGFESVRRCQLGDSGNERFVDVEDPSRYVDAVGIEAIKGI